MEGVGIHSVSYTHLDVYKRQKERFANWQGQDFDEDTLEPSEVAHAIMEYLDCECTYFPSMRCV